MPELRGLVGSILVVDDEQTVRRTLKMILEGEGATVTEARSAEEALKLLGDDDDFAGYHALIADVTLPKMSGLTLLERMREPGAATSAIPIILISGQATLSEAARAIRLGAFDFLEKPLARDRIVVSVRNALRQHEADSQLRRLRAQVRCQMIGESPAMLELFEQIVRVGATRARVLIEGESGTGKELVAHAIHEASERRGKPFLKVNCAAIPRDLIESELFGHSRGAFTGAAAHKRGLFELADGGTLLLDEIGDMDLGAQAKVLRVLQSGELRRVGGEQPIKVDVRVIAATHQDLREQMQRGQFREDLYFRLAVVPITVPPLRERGCDIARLCSYYLELACRENGTGTKQMTPAAQAALTAYAWPGNVRELRNVIERAVILSDGDITLDDLPPDITREPAPMTSITSNWLVLDPSLTPPGISLRVFRESVERAYILQRLAEHGGNVSKTAEALCIERTHLHRKLRLFEALRES